MNGQTDANPPCGLKHQQAEKSANRWAAQKMNSRVRSCLKGHLHLFVVLFGITISLALPRWALAVDELGNITAPSAPGVQAPVPPTVLEPQLPNVPMPDIVADPVSPEGPELPVLPGEPEPGAVTIPAFNATLPASNATFPFGNGTFPVYNATIPAGNGTLPAENGTLPASDGTYPLGNGTYPVHNATEPVYKATMPAANGTRPAYNATVPVPVQVEVTPVIVPSGPLTPADFLPKTMEQPEKAVAETQPVKPEKKPEKKEPGQKANKKESEKDVPEKKPVPEKAPSKPELQKASAQGDPMVIPEEAKKTGSVAFLEGCWVGRRPEYHSKRMITERFCFDAKGAGKRTISDPFVAGQCVGATTAVMNQGGVLRIASERGHCTSGMAWGRADMTCRGEGSNTPCTWNFEDVGGNAGQSYKILFVRD